MTRRRVTMVCAAALALALLAVAAARPAPILTVAPSSWLPTLPHIRVGYHVHSTQSDGSGTVESIAQAAAVSGLHVVVLTDHGDGTQAPAPRYVDGVLCIEAVEVNTEDGHVVALGMRPSPYPLAGPARSVVEDIHRLGGMAVAAHPDSPRENLRWRDWSVPVDGLEWLNADSEWRDELGVALGRLLLTYWLGPPQALASLLDRPGETLTRWDAMTRRAAIVGLAGSDAHARLQLRNHTPGSTSRVEWHVPSYAASFQTFSTRVIPERALTGDANADARVVLAALARGRAYTVIDGFAQGGITDFRLVSGAWQAETGGILPIDGPVAADVKVHGPPGTRVTLLRDGQPWYETDLLVFRRYLPAEPGVWRLEARVPMATALPGMPWLLTNPIYLDTYAQHRRAAAVVAGSAVTPMGLPVSAAVTEHSPAAKSVLRPRTVVDGRDVSRWEFALSASDTASYAALAVESLDLAGTDRLLLRAQASSPMRLAVQLRRPGDAADGERWGSSVYVDETEREYEIPLAGFRPIGEAAAAPPLELIDRVLLVVDTVNHRPAHSGHLLIHHLAAGKR